MGEVLVELRGAGSASIPDVNLEIRRGEVLGLSGLLGSGRQRDPPRLIFGVDRMERGEVDVRGRKTEVRGTLAAIRSGFAFCPENRKTEGIVGDLTIRENIVLALQTKRGMLRAISRAEAEKIADEYIEKLAIKTPSQDQLIRNLSGGNQQKVILARWLATSPDLLMLDEPTRGIDIGTKAEDQKDLSSSWPRRAWRHLHLVRDRRGAALRNRMAVLRDKVKVAELSGEEISEAAIMNLIAGGAQNEQPA